MEAGGKDGLLGPLKAVIQLDLRAENAALRPGDNVATFFATYCDPLIVICQTSLLLARTAHKEEPLPVFLWL